ncbi:hypothetical protein KY343_03105 [Candidatus Woesearchaeota archaeon]|nr:hypothetical protein [Candidatus Woesearchaeota archaeon]
MKGENKLKFISIFTVLYLIVFTIMMLVYKNLEFLYYIIIIAALTAVAVYRKKTFYLTPHLIISLSILGFLHLAGGVFYPFGIRLYDLYI